MRWSGYPACAGIDPVRRRHTKGHSRLPRMRGDRPDRVSLIQGLSQATPHARGSTRPAPLPPAPGLGYPACAGIDLTRLTAPLGTARLPRMRGDRPWLSPKIAQQKRATPHARGSTCPRKRGKQEAHGYPACAGIDPTRKQASCSRARLPRMRGDRPPGLAGV